MGGSGFDGEGVGVGRTANGCVRRRGRSGGVDKAKYFGTELTKSPGCSTVHCNLAPSISYYSG